MEIVRNVIQKVFPTESRKRQNPSQRVQVLLRGLEEWAGFRESKGILRLWGPPTTERP